jgi:hypothetical protein
VNSRELSGSLPLFSVRYRTEPEKTAADASAGACVRQRTELAPGMRLRSSSAFTIPKEKPVTLGTILLIILVLMLIGAIPRWSHSRTWGYGPSGGLGLVLVVVVALLLMGRL